MTRKMTRSSKIRDLGILVAAAIPLAGLVLAIPANAVTGAGAVIGSQTMELHDSSGDHYISGAFNLALTGPIQAGSHTFKGVARITNLSYSMPLTGSPCNPEPAGAVVSGCIPIQVGTAPISGRGSPGALSGTCSGPPSTPFEAGESSTVEMLRLACLVSIVGYQSVAVDIQFALISIGGAELDQTLTGLPGPSLPVPTTAFLEGIYRN